MGGVYAQSLGATATTFTGNRGTSTEGVGAAGAIYGASNPPNPVVSFGYNLVGNAKGCSWSHPATAAFNGAATSPASTPAWGAPYSPPRCEGCDGG